MAAAAREAATSAEAAKKEARDAGASVKVALVVVAVMAEAARPDACWRQRGGGGESRVGEVGGDGGQRRRSRWRWRWWRWRLRRMRDGSGGEEGGEATDRRSTIF